MHRVYVVLSACNCIFLCILATCSLQRRTNTHDLSNEALAFRPVLGSMLARIYHNPQNKEENQERLQKVLQFWASKEVYDRETIRLLESEMMGGLPTNSFAGHQQRDFSSVPADPSTFAGNVISYLYAQTINN